MHLQSIIQCFSPFLDAENRSSVDLLDFDVLRACSALLTLFLWALYSVEGCRILLVLSRKSDV